MLWSHSFHLGGFGFDPVTVLTREAEDTGVLSVDAFFLLSGFLIARSFQGSGSLGRFLWHRVLRIFPGYWACLVVVAFGFAPLLYIQEHATLSGFLTASPSPSKYVSANAFLLLNQTNIGALLEHAPLPRLINHSLWTLQYEFICYLALTVFGMIALRRRAPGIFLAPLLICLMLFAATVLVRGMHPPTTPGRVLEFFTFFSIGTCAYLFRDRIPMRFSIAVFCAALFAATLATRLYGIVMPLTLSYAVLYAAMRLPLRNFDRRADLSYGIYIYAFAIQQTLTAFGAAALGFFGYFFTAFAISIAFAAASWFAIEKRCLALKNLTIEAPWRRRAGQTTALG